MLTIYNSGSPAFYVADDLVGVFEYHSYEQVGFFRDRVLHAMDGRPLFKLGDIALHPIGAAEPSTLYFNPSDVDRLRGVSEAEIPYG